MFIPELTITPKILRNISAFEYGKAIVESTVILPTWEKQLQKEARIEFIFGSLQTQGLNIQMEDVKKCVDGIETSPTTEINNINEALDLISEIAKNKDLEEIELKYIHKTLTKNITPKVKQGMYRNNTEPGKAHPEEILAEIVELFDWFSSLDAREMHPVITAGIIKVRLEAISPFDLFNSTCADLAMLLALKISGYNLRDFINIESYFNKTKNEYKSYIENAKDRDNDFTRWIEYFCEGIAMEVLNIQEKVKLLAKDTKIAKATGRIKLTERQEKIVAYLQDYGLMQNKDFVKLFPDKSEDSVLRDLKILIDKGIIIKAGSTKSSRYELK